MIVDSKYMKMFDSNKITTQKYSEIYNHALMLNNHKNLVSKDVVNNLETYLDMNKLSFVTYMRDKYKGVINSNFDNQLYTDVFITYSNKFEAIQKSITFHKIQYLGIDKYLKDTKQFKKGDFKRVLINKSKTPLTITLTYLARYGNENTLEYIKNQLLIADKDKIEFYNSILNHIEKFGLDRLLKLAMSKRTIVLNKYSNPITFKSLTFRGRSRKTGNIISYNRRFGSKINSFINISWLSRGSTMTIPVKYNKDYHGHMSEYLKKSNDIEYVMSFTDKKQVRISICKDGVRNIPDNKINFVGIDVNLKHNMFALSDGSTLDYNRSLLNKLSLELLKIDNLKKNKDYKVGKKRESLIKSLTNKLHKDIEKKCSNLCKDLKTKGLDHIIMEDLQKTFSKSHVKNQDGMNYNRVQSLLRMSSLKDTMEHIARKHDISVSTVHAEYTSKMCSVCGSIHDENRPNQETFCCIECGHNSNADLNAAINIKNRVNLTVLRQLLKQNPDTKTYCPKILDRNKVKEVLISCLNIFSNEKEKIYSNDQV